MTPEQTQLLTVAGSIAGTAITLLGGPAAIRAGLRWWAGYVERRAKARERVEATTLGTLRDLVDDLRRRVERVESENRELRDEVEELRAENASLRARLLRYEQRSTTPPGAYALGRDELTKGDDDA